MYAGSSPVPALLSYFGEILNERMSWFLVKITKNEAQILNVKYEIPFKEFGGITRTCSCHHKRKTYYLTESNYNLNALSEIRKNIVEWQNI